MAPIRGATNGAARWITRCSAGADQNTLKRTDLDDFVACWFGKPGSTPHPGPLPARGGEGASRHNRVETERFKSFTYEELTSAIRLPTLHTRWGDGAPSD